MIDLIVHFTLDYGIRFFLYLVLFVSMLYVASEIIRVPLKGKVASIKSRARLKKRRANQLIEDTKQQSSFIRHIHFLLQTTSKKEYDVVTFFIVSLSIFLTTFLLVVVNFQDVVVSIMLSVFAGMLPYLLLQVRLRNIQNSVGNELLPVVSDMSQNYNAHQYDMYRTLVETAKETKSAPIKKVFVRLISDLQTARNENDLRDSIALFIYTCGNSWSMRLGNIILKAYNYDENVMNALLALNRQMEETEKMLEEEKSTAMAPVVDGFLTVPILIGSLVLGYYVSGPQDWVNLQFNEGWTMLTFVSMLSLTVLSVLIAMLLKNPKNDL